MGAAEYVLQAFNIVWTLFLWTWWIFLIGGMWAMKKKYEAHPVDAIIIEKRGDNLIKTNDRAGRRVNKDTMVSFYQLKSSGETMPVYDFELMLHNADKPMSIFEKIVMFLRPTIGTIFLFKYGSKQYKPISIGMNKSTEEMLKLVECKDKNGEILYNYEYSQFDPRWVLGVLDFEVVDWDNMNFMVQEQRATMQRRASGLDWMKQLAIPALIIAGSVIAALFILKFSADAGASLQGGGGQPAPKDTGTGGIIGGAIDGAMTPAG